MIKIRHRFFFYIYSFVICSFAATQLSAAEVSVNNKASAKNNKPSSIIVSEYAPLDDKATNASSSGTSTSHDPLEKFNRAMFKFNEFFDDYLLKPVSELYSKIVPKPLAKGIGNIYNNIDTIPTVLNDLFMGNFYQATNDFWRLGINTTLGIGGLFDVASRMGLEPNTEDFGLTLARWGWTNSTYVVIPFMGPSTIRDGALGFPVNYYLLSVYPYIHPSRVQFGVYSLGIVSRRADLIHYQEVMDSVAIDKYVFMRDAYLQRRNYLIERNKELSHPSVAKNTLQEKVAAKAEQKAEEQTKPFSSI